MIAYQVVISVVLLAGLQVQIKTWKRYDLGSADVSKKVRIGFIIGMGLSIGLLVWTWLLR